MCGAFEMLERKQQPSVARLAGNYAQSISEPWARLSKACHLPGGVESVPTVSKHDKAALLV